MVFCMWLNDTFGHELPAGYTFRLPTEAEWEKAARGTDGWGNIPGQCLRPNARQ